jgi:hypothetical protein
MFQGTLGDGQTFTIVPALWRRSSEQWNSPRRPEFAEGVVGRRADLTLEDQRRLRRGCSSRENPQAWGGRTETFLDRRPDFHVMKGFRKLQATLPNRPFPLLFFPFAASESPFAALALGSQPRLISLVVGFYARQVGRGRIAGSIAQANFLEGT